MGTMFEGGEGGELRVDAEGGGYRGGGGRSVEQNTVSTVF